MGLTGEAYFTHTKFTRDEPAGMSATTYSYGLRFGITAFVF